MKKELYFLVAVMMIVGIAATISAEPVRDIPEKERCPVCGMMVAKYVPWITQLQKAEGETVMFDGVKDMMAYFFAPEKYGGSPPFISVYVKDYYSLEWIDGKKAIFVTGSDVLGPMGHEFIPFSSMSAAENFKKDHHGTMILTFEQIAPEMVEGMRSGMKGHKMKHGN